jgi:hypothetical protein
MTSDAFAANLSYTCSLQPSIAEARRRNGINRQHLNKYLAGSMRRLRF